MRPRLYLIDGHAVAYRQFFGLKQTGFATADGESTTAVYGFSRLLQRLIHENKPEYLAVTFDNGLTGRDAVFPDYKANRVEMPEDLGHQLMRIRQIIRAFNVPVVEEEGYEADDVIGTIVRQLEAQDIDIWIITGDKDLLQLLREGVRLELPSRRRGEADEIYDMARYQEEYGLHPDQHVDLKALMGDKSDNIPGVRGIGEKTAVKLLQQYQSLDGIYAHLDKIKGSNNKKLAEGRELAYLSHILSTIRCDLPVAIALDACATQNYDANAVVELYRELQFRSLLNDLLAVEAGKTADDAGIRLASSEPVETVIVDDADKLDVLVRVLEAAQTIVWDVETTSIDQMQAELVGIALAVDTRTGYYVPVGHRGEAANTLFAAPAEDQLPLQTVLDALRGPLTDPAIAKCAHNAVYDLVVMRRYGIDVSPVAFDTMIAEWLHEPTSKFLGLKAFANQYLHYVMTPIEDLIGKGKKQKTMDQVSVADAAPYASADAAITFRAVEHLRPELEGASLTTLYNTLEMPLVPVLASMQQTGVALDVGFLHDFSQRLAKTLLQIEQEIYDLSGGYGAFNINSPKQLNDVLFGKLGLPVEGLKKTTHGYSTDVVTLERLKTDTAHPILVQILEYRELSKLKSTYVDALPELVNPATGRVHTSYNQTGTSTGRLSSSNPNLQNIPIRTETGRKVRRAFVAPEGYQLLAVDYSQIELRVLAHISQDQTLLAAFAQDQDIHRATAATVYGVPLESVTYEQRSFAKRVNFGLIYGMGPFRLSRDSDLTLAEAEAFVDTYFERLPGVKDYIGETKKQAAADGYLTTLFGRKRFFPALKRGDGGRSASAEERAAINMPIQGTAADIMKKAMIELDVALKQSNARMILQVHDELVLEVAADELDTVARQVVDVMETTFTMDAPLKANAEAGPNWRDMVGR